jgi:methionyl-tRNA formyltransferase
MKIIFAGTPEFSVPALEALLAAGHDVVAVYTQPDRQAGRGRKTRPGPVKACAEKHGLAVEQPATLKNSIANIRNYAADIMVVVAYGIILPPEILEIPKHGCLNIHASLLPRWRGAAPIQRAIEAGDEETGITIMQMDKGLDTGDILALYPVVIEHTDSARSLHDKLAETGAAAIVEVLGELDQYQDNATPQPTEDASYARKITTSERTIDWTEDCAAIERRIRAFNPWPGTQTCYEDTRLRIWKAECETAIHHTAPGTILAADGTGIKVACGTGILKIHQLQRPGGKPLPVADFLNGMTLATGTKLSPDADD